MVAVIVVLAGRRGLVDGELLHVFPCEGAALAYGIAFALGGSGFIAAFVAWMTLRLVLKLEPGFSVEAWIDRDFYQPDGSSAALLIDGARKAGLPVCAKPGEPRPSLRDPRTNTFRA